MEETPQPAITDNSAPKSKSILPILLTVWIALMVITIVVFIINSNKSSSLGPAVTPVPTVAQNPPTGECVVGGCSGTLCLDHADAGNIATTCEWKEEYACYKMAKCEKQSDGKCGFTKTEEFNKCFTLKSLTTVGKESSIPAGTLICSPPPCPSTQKLVCDKADGCPFGCGMICAE